MVAITFASISRLRPKSATANQQIQGAAEEGGISAQSRAHTQTKKMEEQKWKSGIDSLYNKIVKTSKTPATKSAK